MLAGVWFGLIGYIFSSIIIFKVQNSGQTSFHFIIITSAVVFKVQTNGTSKWIHTPRKIKRRAFYYAILVTHAGLLLDATRLRASLPRIYNRCLVLRLGSARAYDHGMAWVVHCVCPCPHRFGQTGNQARETQYAQGKCPIHFFGYVLCRRRYALRVHVRDCVCVCVCV